MQIIIIEYNKCTRLNASNDEGMGWEVSGRMRGRDDTRGDGEREREKKGAREREERGSYLAKSIWFCLVTTVLPRVLRYPSRDPLPINSVIRYIGCSSSETPINPTRLGCDSVLQREGGREWGLSQRSNTNVITDASARNCCVACPLFISFNILMATLLPLYSPSHTSERERERE